MSESERSYKVECIETALQAMLLTDDSKAVVHKFNLTYELLVELFIDQIFKLKGEE